MGIANRKIGELINRVDVGELILPEIQRDFVWGRKNVLLLFDSLYRGLPIGTMLVWKVKAAVPAKKMGHQQSVGQIIPNFYGYLLDGQQRLTAISLVRDGSEDYPLVFSLRPKHESDPSAERFAFKAKWNMNPWFVSVSDILLDLISPFNKIQELKDLSEFRQGEEESIWASLTKLKSILEYDIGVIEFEDDDYKKATELFIRFNSTGKKLTKSDLAASELALQVPTLVSERINQFANQYTGFRFTKPFLIQCLSAVHKSKLKFSQAREIWDGSDESSIIRSWKKTEKGIGRVISLLTGTLKWDSIMWIPSINSLIPLVYIFSEKKPSPKQMINARSWLLLTGANAFFSGTVHTKIDRILRKMQNEKTIEKLWDITTKNLYNMVPDDFLTKRRSGSIMALFVSMIRNNNAKDWKDNTSLDGSVIGHNAKLQVHHFFPKKLLASKGYVSDDINIFANYAIINADTNINLSSKEPYNYIGEENIPNKELDIQCVPVDKDLWKVERYEDFLLERRILLAERANEFLGIAS